jgi:hypothetical protein
MAGTNTKTNQNQYEFVQLQSPQADVAISLQRPCKRFTLVMPSNNQVPSVFVIAYLSFAPMGLIQPFNLGSLPEGVVAFPMFMFINGNRSDECPSIEFECPFTEFVMNFYAIDTGDGSLQNLFGTLVCSESGIKNYKTTALPGVQFG